MGERWIKMDEKLHDIVLVAARNKLLYKTADVADVQGDPGCQCGISNIQQTHSWHRTS